MRVSLVEPAAAPAPIRPPSPPLGHRAYAKVYSRVLWPAWERLVRGRTTPAHLAFVTSTQWASRDEIEEHQLRALRALLTHAGAHVPYYRALFARLGFDARDVKRREDVAQLPVLSRDTVRERHLELVDPACARANVKKGTSGSTGAPLSFEYSRESECWRNAIRIRSYAWAGYVPGLPTYLYWGQAGALAGLHGWKVRLDRALRRETYVDSMKQDEASRRAALDLFRRMRPSIVVCYTQSCAQWARWILDEGLRAWDDVPVLCGAEAVLPADRAALVRAFGPHVFETYGSRETMLMAQECEAHDGLHVMEENVLVEIARNGIPAAPGRAGDVLVTDLHNYGMPFIRYQNGDVAVMAKAGKCACGRSGLRKLQRVEGRRVDTLLDRDGNPIPGLVFHVLFADTSRDLVRQFQAVQKPCGTVVLKVVRGHDWSPERFDEMTRRFGQYLRGLPLEIEFHEAIPPSPGGKLRTIVVER